MSKEYFYENTIRYLSPKPYKWSIGGKKLSNIIHEKNPDQFKIDCVKSILRHNKRAYGLNIQDSWNNQPITSLASFYKTLKFVQRDLLVHPKDHVRIKAPNGSSFHARIELIIEIKAVNDFSPSQHLVVRKFKDQVILPFQFQLKYFGSSDNKTGFTTLGYYIKNIQSKTPTDLYISQCHVVSVKNVLCPVWLVEGKLITMVADPSFVQEHTQKDGTVIRLEEYDEEELFNEKCKPYMDTVAV